MVLPGSKPSNSGGYGVGGNDINVTNSGSIFGFFDGTDLDGGVLNNEASGTVTGEIAGVTSDRGAGTVTNAGAIAGNATISLPAWVYGYIPSAELPTYGSLNGSGVAFVDGGTVTNSGSITGASLGVFITTNAGTVTNSGSISGTTASVEFGGGGANSLTLETGSSLTGEVIGSKAGGATNALVLQGTGTAANTFLNFNSLSIQSGAGWSLGGTSTFGSATDSGGNLTVAGDLTISGGVTGSGAITLGAGATLNVGQVAAGVGISFSGVGAALSISASSLDANAFFDPTLTGLAIGDAIDFGAAVTTASVSNQVLSLFNGSQLVAKLHVSGLANSTQFTITALSGGVSKIEVGAMTGSAAPVLTATNGASVSESYASLINLVTDPSRTVVSVTAAALDAGSVGAGTVSLDATNQSVDFTPAAGFEGTAVIDVTLADATGLSVVQPLDVNVVVQASPPVVVLPDTTTTSVNGNVTTIKTYTPDGALVSTEVITVNGGQTVSIYTNAQGTRYEATIQTVTGNETQFQTFDGNWNQQSASITFDYGGGDTVVQNFDGSWNQTGAVLTTVNGNVTVVQNFYANWAQKSATITTVNGAATETQNFDNSWNQISANITTNLAGGEVESQNYDANWRQVSATLTTQPSADQTEVQTFDGSWQQDAATITTVANGQTTTQSFDGNWVQITATIDTPNPTSALLDRLDVYDDQWRLQVETDTALNGGVSYFDYGVSGGAEGFTASTSHSTTYVFTPGTLNGDVIAGLHTLNLGGAIHDVIDFEGYGAGAHLVQVNSTEWQLVSNDRATETFTLTGGSILGDGDYAFVPTAGPGSINIVAGSAESGSGSITVTTAGDVGIYAVATGGGSGDSVVAVSSGGQSIAAATTSPSVALFTQFAAAGAASSGDGGGLFIAAAPTVEPMRLALPAAFS